MNELIIKNTNGIPVVDSVTVANGANVTHNAVMKLTRKYLSDFETFGRVAFEIQPFETAGGVQKREIAWLNEDQATLLFTYLRNNDITRKFKIRLVQAFREYRNKVEKLKQEAYAKLPDFTDPIAAARAWADEKEKTKALELQIKQDAPKVEAAEDFLKSDGDHIIRLVAKTLGVGVRFLFDWMRQNRLINKFNEPYAEFVTRGLLRPVPSYHESSDGTSKTKLTTHITNEGVFYLWNRLKKDGVIPADKQLQLNLLWKKE